MYIILQFNLKQNNQTEQISVINVPLQPNSSVVNPKQKNNKNKIK